MDLWTRLPLDIRRYLRFIIGGGLSLLLNLAITYLLTELLHLWHMLSFAIALGVEILFLFVYHTRITFKQNGNFFRFAFITLFISGLNWVFVYVLSEVLGIYYLVSIVVSALVISVLNYTLNRFFVFGSPAAHKNVR